MPPGRCHGRVVAEGSEQPVRPTVPTTPVQHSRGVHGAAVGSWGGRCTSPPAKDSSGRRMWGGGVVADARARTTMWALWPHLTLSSLHMLTEVRNTSLLLLLGVFGRPRQYRAEREHRRQTTGHPETRSTRDTAHIHLARVAAVASGKAHGSAEEFWHPSGGGPWSWRWSCRLGGRRGATVYCRIGAARGCASELGRRCGLVGDLRPPLGARR